MDQNQDRTILMVLQTSIEALILVVVGEGITGVVAVLVVGEAGHNVTEVGNLYFVTFIGKVV